MNDKLECIENKIEGIENTLETINQTLFRLNVSIENLSNRLDIKETLDDQVLEECKKMGAHIDFVENVYDNVKHPLGFICNKIRYMTGNNSRHLLTDISNSNQN